MKEKKGGAIKEKVDRKALFSIKNSSLYRERGSGGKFKPKSQSKPVATSTPKLVLKRCEVKSIETITNAPNVEKKRERPIGIKSVKTTNRN